MIQQTPTQHAERGHLGTAECPMDCGLEFGRDYGPVADLLLRHGVKIEAARINPQSNVIRLTFTDEGGTTIFYASAAGLVWLGETLSEFGQWAIPVNLAHPDAQDEAS
ncbi:MAG: hypothetical protein A2V98_17695 [Planctomycetes bacterium RBG_16_64_12]|nr:MAG: hypothetical protein A2V98_17695 [Planctomycetes bacterium RBG_16_64_12]